MGGMYLGLKSRAVVLKREQQGPREGNYGVEIHRSGTYVWCLKLDDYIADGVLKAGESKARV